MMRRIVVMVLVLALLADGFAQNVSEEASIGYSMTLHYKEGALTLVDLKLVGGYPDHIIQPDEGYTLRVVSVRNETLYSFKFSVELEPVCAYEPWSNRTCPPPKNETDVFLGFPYFRNAKQVEVYDQNGSLTLTADVSQYARCNMNGVCEANEFYSVCPEDCPPEKTLPSEVWKPDWLRIGGFAVLIAIGVFLAYKKLRRQPSKRKGFITDS